MAALTAQNIDLNKRLDRAEAAVARYENQAKRAAAREDPIAEEILCLLADANACVQDHIVQVIGRDHQLVRYHLDELLLRQYVIIAGHDLGESIFSLSHQGRAYLVRHGMLR